MNKEVLSNLVLENNKQVEILERIEITKKELADLMEEHNNSLKRQIDFIDIIISVFFKNKKKLNKIGSLKKK